MGYMDIKVWMGFLGASQTVNGMGKVMDMQSTWMSMSHISGIWAFNHLIRAVGATQGQGLTI